MYLRSPDIFFFILGHYEDLSEPYFPVHYVTNDWINLLLGLHVLEICHYNRLSRRSHSLSTCGLSCLERGGSCQHYFHTSHSSLWGFSSESKGWRKPQRQLCPLLSNVFETFHYVSYFFAFTDSFLIFVFHAFNKCFLVLVPRTRRPCPQEFMVW